MKNYFKILIFCILLSSCSQQKLEQEFFSNGNLKLQSELDINGIRNGLYEEFYENGVTKIKTKYKNGFAVDTFYHFHSNRNIKAKGLHQKELPVGWWTYYDTLGRLAEKKEYRIRNDSIFKNQSIYYDSDGQIKTEPSTYFEILVPDTIQLGKNVARLNKYVTNFNDADDNLVAVIINNKYSEKEVKMDTFSNGTLKPFFGIFGYKKGYQNVEGTIEEIIISTDKINPDSSTLKILKHFKYFKKKVFVNDDGKRTELGQNLISEMEKVGGNN